MKFRGASFLSGRGLLLTAAPLLMVWAGAWADDRIVQQRTLTVESQAIAWSGDFVVTVAEVQAFLDDRVTPEHQAGVLQSDERLGQMLRDLMITQQLSASAAASPDFTQDDEALLLHRINVMLRSWYRGHYLQSVELDDYEPLAREIFLAQGTLFSAPERFDFRHLLIEVEPERTEAEAMAIVLDVIDRIEAGEDFEAIIRELSDDRQGAEAGGMISKVSLDELVPQLAAVLATTGQEELADPVRSRFGWHVAKLIRRHPPEQLEWEEAKELALQLARENHLNQAWERRLRALFAEQMQTNAAAVEGIRQAHGAVQPTE